MVDNLADIITDQLNKYRAQPMGESRLLKESEKRKGVMSKISKMQRGVEDAMQSTTQDALESINSLMTLTRESRTLPEDKETPDLDYFLGEDIDEQEKLVNETGLFFKQAEESTQEVDIKDAGEGTIISSDSGSAVEVQPDTDGKVTHTGSFDNKEDYLKVIIPAAKEASEKTGLDWRLIVAQSAIETGWGSKVKGNSFFGIKGHGAEDTVSFTTQEEVDGKRVTIKDEFRSYDTLEDSVAGYANFLLDNPRYKDYLAAVSLEDASKALQASGYATDSNYGKKVLKTAKGAILKNFLKNNPEFK